MERTGTSRSSPRRDEPGPAPRYLVNASNGKVLAHFALPSLEFSHPVCADGALLSASPSGGLTDYVPRARLLRSQSGYRVRQAPRHHRSTSSPSSPVGDGDPAPSGTRLPIDPAPAALFDRGPAASWRRRPTGPPDLLHASWDGPVAARFIRCRIRAPVADHGGAPRGEHGPERRRGDGRGPKAGFLLRPRRNRRGR